MSPTKRLFIPTTLIAALAVSLGACSFDVDIDDDGDDNDVTRRTERDQLSADGINTIELHTNDGSVTVTAGDGDSIELATTLRQAGNIRARSSIATVGDTITIDGFCSNEGSSKCSVAYEVSVPDGVNVDVVTDDGSIVLDAIDGIVTARSDDGAIFGTALNASSFTASSEDGAIDLDFASEPDRVDVRTDDGSITIVVPDDATPYNVSTTIDDGSVSINVNDDPSADRSIIARTEDGSVSIGTA